MFRDRQIVNKTNFVVVSSVGIKRDVCNICITNDFFLNKGTGCSWPLFIGEIVCDFLFALMRIYPLQKGVFFKRK